MYLRPEDGDALPPVPHLNNVYITRENLQTPAYGDRRPQIFTHDWRIIPSTSRSHAPTGAGRPG